MGSFQLRSKLSITVFIIVIIFVVWFLIKLSLYLFATFQPQLSAHAPESIQASYTEKIDNFTLQKFGVGRQLIHFIQARYYLRFKNSPALLVDPKVTTYNKQGEQSYVLSAKRAHYLASGEIQLHDKVVIDSNTGAKHKINTAELLISTKTNDIIGRNKVVYLGEGVNLVSEGIFMHAKQDRVKLLGEVRIKQNSGQEIITKDIYIDQTKEGHKHYHSKNNTTYLTPANEVHADGIDMNMQTQQLQLLGQVNITRNPSLQINTQDLTVEQSQNQEVYHTNNKVHYQSLNTVIRATGMRYDVKNQTIKLAGGVVGRYE